jgi:ribonuclease BN (tRNA processing enzyme)
MGPLAITVLGSGSPLPHRSRASSSYLVWLDDRPSLLVDAGGGTVERLGRLGVDLTDLDAVLLTHLHIDHSGGLAPVVFGAWMQGRSRPLALAGPAGREGTAPGCRRFVDLLFGEEGAWAYLGGWDGFGLDVTEIDPDVARSPRPIDLPGPAAVSAVGVSHGGMPAVAFRIDHGGRSVAFSGDIDGGSASLVDLARGVDVLVHDQSLPGREGEHGDNHPPPDETGANAASAGAGHLVLSHLMPPAEEAMPAILDAVGSRFDGPVTVAEDLMTVEAGPRC